MCYSLDILVDILKLIVSCGHHGRCLLPVKGNHTYMFCTLYANSLELYWHPIKRIDHPDAHGPRNRGGHWGTVPPHVRKNQENVPLFHWECALLET